MKRFFSFLLLALSLGVSRPADAQTPTLSIADASISESNSGFREMLFPVSLSATLTFDVSASFVTKNITASDKSDYAPQSAGQIVIKAGAIRTNILIRVVSDTVEEKDESFLVQLGAPKRCGISDSDGIGVIKDDDYAGQISISDVSVSEGNSGERLAKALVRFSKPALHDIAVRYETKAGTASAGFDYFDTKGTLLFKPGRVAFDVTVPIRGDRLAEPNDTFSVNLLVAGLMPQKGSARLTIVNDDGAVKAVGGKIVFTSERDGSTELYVMNGDGSRQTRLTFGGYGEQNPRFSKDGAKIVCEAVSGIFGIPRSQILVMNADGTGKTLLERTPTSYNDLYPTFSPDGTKILYLAVLPTGRQLILMNLDGSNRTVIADGKAFPRAAFSPDGRQIVFSSFEKSSATEIVDLYRVNADGSGLTRLTATPDVSESAPHFSPDGKTIVYQARRMGPTYFFISDLMVMNADGSGQIPLPSDAAMDYNPDFSPDGQRVVFQSGRDEDFQIYAFDAEGNRRARLTSSGNNYSPSWAPGSVAPSPVINVSRLSGKIAFVEDNAIWVMNANGTNRTRLTAGGNDQPRFSPDGTQIVFISRRVKATEVWIMNADGSNQTRITITPTDTYKILPSFSPDGQKIIFSELSNAQTNTSDIYTVNRDGSGLSKIQIEGGAPGEFRFAYAAQFSPDGRKIAFSTSAENRIYTSQGKIYTMNADGTRAVLIRDGLVLPEPSSTYYSPDGKKLMFSTLINGYDHVHVMNADGSGEVGLTDRNSEASSQWPCFSPDGGKILYVFGRGELYVMNPDGTGKTAIPNNRTSGTVLALHWAPGTVPAPQTGTPAESVTPSAGTS